MRRLGLIRTAFFATLALSPRLLAQGPSCPSRDAVRGALAALAGDARSRAALDEAERADLELEDLGQRYRVTVNGRSREYGDPQRDCTTRAQVAAVFVALVLNPAGAEAAESSPALPAPPLPPPRRMPSPLPAARRVDVRTGASYLRGFAAGNAPHAAGVIVRGAYMLGELGVELGVALPASSASLTVGPARAELLRYGVDLSGRYGFSAGPLGVNLEAGAALSALEVRNVSEGARPAVTRLEPALRLGGGLRLRAPRLSPAFGVVCSLVPVRYPLALEPTGVLARTPAVWLGGWLGLSATFG